MKKLLRYSRLGSATVLASAPLLALAGCGSSNETPAPIVKVEPVVLTPAEKAWAEKAAANKAEVLSLKEALSDSYYKTDDKGEKYTDGFSTLIPSSEERAKPIYLPIGFSLPSDVKWIGHYTFTKTALPEGFYLGEKIHFVGGGALQTW